jgi:antirestriction protein
MAGYLEKALTEKPEKKEKLSIHWSASTVVAVKEFCIHHKGWHMSNFSEVAMLEKIEREKALEEKKPAELLMRHGTKEP